jgi:predicted metal-dependent enzyme (double-stranded beta helix superfamily)
MATTTFDIDRFVEECRAALTEHVPTSAVRELLERHVGSAAARSTTTTALPPERAGLESLHVADDLTVLKVVWGPEMTLFPHDHRMWAVIGIYAGAEDNAFYRRAPEGLTTSGGKSLEDGDTLVLGDDAIHSVHNPRSSYSGAIHVYGGDFFGAPRSEWDPETLEEMPYDVEHTRQLFEESNARVPGS